jgi:hypothetical protein
MSKPYSPEQMTEFKITVYRLPPAECSPNSRAHWAVRKKAADNFSQEVYIETLKNRRMLWPDIYFQFSKAEISLTLIVKQHRRRDLDNWWARFKPGADALVQAGILTDDDAEHLQHGKIEFIVDPAQAPRTEIILRGA